MRDKMPCCGARQHHSWDAGTRTHEPTCKHFKETATVRLRQNATTTTVPRETIGEGSIFKSVEVRCSNGVTVNVYPDGSVKQTRHDGSFTITAPNASDDPAKV